MYEHADQTWRQQPHVMAATTRALLAERIAEYAEQADLAEIVVLFHGGEPLLAGAPAIASTASLIRSAVRPSTEISFSLQTNGVLLDRAALDILAAEGITVSVSIDGARAANDLHRRTRKGESSFEPTMAAIELLRSYPNQFAGIISVVDPAVPAVQLLEFFETCRPPSLDFLLPDANYLRQPPQRDRYPSIYSDWLIDAFDVWFDRFSHLPVRTFDEVLRCIVGLPSGTDAFGTGAVSLLTIETDGSYHDLDVLKITADGATAIGLDLASSPIAEAASSGRIRAHEAVLTLDGLCEECRSCPEVAVCGGGSVPHRYDHDGFDHPTVYCAEMLDLIGHARRRVSAQLNTEPTQVALQVGQTLEGSFDKADASARYVGQLLSAWEAEAVADLRWMAEVVPNTEEIAPLLSDPLRLARLATCPSVVLRARVMRDSLRGITTRSPSGAVLTAATNLGADLREISETLSLDCWAVHRDDPWIRAPFGHPIAFEDDSERLEAGRGLLGEAAQLIGKYSPPLLREMLVLTRDVQFVRDLEADEGKIVSFSDDSVPGAVYVSIRHGEGSITVYDLADSLIHEHRHQKLYLLQRACRLVEKDSPRVRSPWRADMRPPSGLLHAAYVFVELRRFWRYLATVQPEQLTTRAETEIAITEARLDEAWRTLKTVSLTPAGRDLVSELMRSYAE